MVTKRSTWVTMLQDLSFVDWDRLVANSNPTISKSQSAKARYFNQ